MRPPLRLRAARWACVATLGVLCGAAGAHDLITSESAQRYLAQAGAQLDTIRSSRGASVRADANYALGRMLDEICELLNRDLAAHGKVQGLATEYLVRELQAKQIALSVSPSLGRFPANIAYYREALRLSPDGLLAGAAMLHWLRGHFYDSFRDDPLQPLDQSYAALVEQIALAERFLARYPDHAEREEAQFILLVHLAQAARTAPDAASRQRYAARTREAARQFSARYSDSMRAAAVPVLLEQLPPR